MVKITSINVYPVKSCKGISVDQAIVQETGFRFDRHWMIVNAAGRFKGKFVTQRQISKMALISTNLPADILSGKTDPSEDTFLSISAPGKEDLKVPVLSAKASAGELLDCVCWEWTGKAKDEGDAAADWFSSFLEKEVRLVRYVGTPSNTEKASADPTRRATDPEFAAGYEVPFADGFPVLVATEASLEDLNSKLEEPIKMNRFRPNIVVSGCAPWAEDGWATLSSTTGSGGPSFRAVKPCSRCKIPTTNQETAEVGDEPSKALGVFRNGEILGLAAKYGPSWKREVIFGENLVPTKLGVLSVGDELEVQ